MGTNYFLQAKPPCECCGRTYSDLHIGKSSGGWCFGLHVIPEEGLNNLEDWKKRFFAPETRIRDEYGRPVSPEQMVRVIAFRYQGESLTVPTRHPVDGTHCVGHGDGTWDHIAGEFF